MMGSGTGWGWFFGGLLLIGLVLLVVVAVRGLGGGLRRDGAGAKRPVGADADRARRLLDERYARGEISTEEYQQRRRVLDEGR